MVNKGIYMQICSISQILLGKLNEARIDWINELFVSINNNNNNINKKTLTYIYIKKKL